MTSATGSETRSLADRLRRAATNVPGSTQAFEFRRRDRQRAGSVLAAGLAARTFLMLLPLAFIVAAVVGFADESSPNFSAREVRAVGLTANLVKVVSQSSADARRGRWILLALGVVLLFYAAHSLYRALFMTHLVAWEMTVVQVRPVSIVATCLLLVSVPIIAGFVSLARVLPLGPLLLLGVPAGIVLYSAMWLLISRLLPHRADRWMGLVPGALAWGVGMMALQLISVFVLPDRLSGMSQLYGALATASSTMFWLFLFGRLTVGAATLNAVLWDRRLKAQLSAKSAAA